MLSSLLLSSILVGPAIAGTVLWDGRANNHTTSAFLDDWSWSNQVGEYQFYIKGPQKTSRYVNLSPSYKNPADASSKQGIQITIDNTSYWNGQDMRRTEFIPQTSAPINAGKLFYHFSLQVSTTNTPSPYEEHQLFFFESHFTELKYGLLSGDNSAPSSTQLRWMVQGKTYWNATLVPGEWHNVAYGIDFAQKTVAFYHSLAGSDLKLIAGPVAASASSDGKDFHLGVLRLKSATGRTDDAPEDWHFSGAYIENAPLTTKVTGPL